MITLGEGCHASHQSSDASTPLTHIIVEVAKALEGSFKLVRLAPKTVREMTQLPKETQKGTQTNQKAQMNTQSTNLG